MEAFKTGGKLDYWVTSWWRVNTTPARCDVEDGFIHPVYEDSAPDPEAAKATGPLVDPYDRRVDDSPDECSIASRT
ncbi:hypothetical protein [Microtetraspora sp. NBRC 13810]|uniref:hypothetical protein n=1 Tax=Microtetraspora sp. NBRC 13810 TaxID=3030990 RepID=UPI0025555025|nr:hypothetical protein [Microtetraspora sp. NBRC 13810]